MPGILPMKVIKVGSSAQARIAQACDRCRSKKIRCDGVRPCCSQCSSVGFECKTSDKLSRRAFPRGYTESLEERVRSLESEVRDLKELLDEKDEKIDMLTRLHPQTAQSSHLPSPRRSSASPSACLSDPACESSPLKEDIFKVQQSPYLLHDGGSNEYFAGTSSAKTFLDSFKHKVQERGRSTADIHAEALLSTSARQAPKSTKSISPVVEWIAPPRLASDQMVNIFFQEWAPLFPILHRPTFLTLYEEYTASPESVTDKTSLALLNLVFGLAAISQGNSSDLSSYESQWQAALDTLLTDQSLPTLQCLVLAQLYCIQRGDYTKLLTYKALAIALSSRLGLHQSQKRFALGTLTCETRKKLFWTLYVIDSFSAVMLGLPRQIKDDDVHCEYPVDADDEYVTERGFQPLLPGESTRLSSALALFRATRILSKVLEEVYPALPSYDLSLQKLSALSEELDQWLASLPTHLRLTFAQDKPSTGTISSRSPLLSLTYHYIRALIHRPAVCASLGSRSSSSMIAMTASSKHIVQIIQLLAERGLTFAFCLHKEELLVLSGLGLLYQSLDLDQDSKLLRDNQKTLASIMSALDSDKASCAAEFRRVACSFLPLAASPNREKAVPVSRHNSDGAMPAPSLSSIPPALKQHFKAMTAKFVPPSMRPHNKPSAIDHRRATESDISLYRHQLMAQSQPTFASHSPSHVSRSEPALSPTSMYLQKPSSGPSPHPHSSKRSSAMLSRNHSMNLDYLSFGNTPSGTPPLRSQPPPIVPVKTEPSDWERLLGSIDGGQTNIFDNIYGGPRVDFAHDHPNTTTNTNKTNANKQQHPFSSDSALHRTTSAPNQHVSDIAEDTIGSDFSANWDTPDIWGLSTADFGPVAADAPPPALSESVISFSTDEGGCRHGSVSGSSGHMDEALAFGTDWNIGEHGYRDGIGVTATTDGSSVSSANEFRGICMPSDFGTGDDGLLGNAWESIFAA